MSDEASDTENCIIDLVNLQEKVWWLDFTSTDMTKKDVNFVARSSINIIELCLALGMDNNEDLNKFRIKKGERPKGPVYRSPLFYIVVIFNCRSYALSNFLLISFSLA